MSEPYNAVDIPEGGLYADIPLYGRFQANKDTFRFDATKHSPRDILAMCDGDTEMMPDHPGCRIFAVGDVIVKWEDRDGKTSYEMGDKNAFEAVQLVRNQFPWLPCPWIHFQG